MILVTVGTHRQGFDRLVKAADQFAKKIDEKVIIQYGCSDYQPKYAESFQWATSKQMEQYTFDARIVITHAAAGAVILALKQKKALIVVPRLKIYNEHFDDHQVQLAKALDAQHKAVAVYHPMLDVLQTAITMSQELVHSETGPSMLVDALKQQLSHWDHKDDVISL